MDNKEAVEYLGKIPIPRLMSNSLEDCIEQDKYYYAIRIGMKAIEDKISTIKELEKIQAEILSECPNTNARMICISILYKHISELKGE